MAKQILTSRWLYLTLAIIATVFLLLRFVNLNYDTPLFYSNLGTSELTDPYMYTSFARNKVLYGVWNPSGSETLTSIQGSLVSGLAYLVFSLVGVSRVTANITALLLQLSGLLFFFWGLRKRLPGHEIILSIFFLSVTNLFFFGGRAPYLETGVIFSSGLLTLVYFRFGRTTLGALSVGLLLAVATFGGKLTAIAIAVPIIADQLFYARKTAIQNSLAIGGGFSIGLLGYAGLFFNWSPLALINYYGAITSAVGITPALPDSIIGIMQSIFTYGDTGIAPFHPFLILLAVIGVALASIRIATERARPEGGFDRRVMVFLIIWVIAGLATLIPFEYRPYRYFLPYLLPLSVLAAHGVSELLRGELKLRLTGRRGWVVALLLALVTGYVFEQASFWWTHYNQDVSLGTKWFSVGMTLTGIATTLVTSVLLYRTGITIQRVLSYVTALTLLSSCLLLQSYFISRGLRNPRNVLQLQNKDIGEILGEGAVLAGNFAPAFTIDNQRKIFVYSYGGALATQKSSLEAAHITHLADPPSLARTALQQFHTTDIVPVLKVWAREATYMIYGLQRPGYQPTDYELAMASSSRNRLDSAIYYLDRFLRKCPHNLTARLERASILATIGRVEPATRELEALSEEFQKIYYVHYIVGQSYLPIAQITKDWKVLRAMRQEYESVIELNPYVARNLRLYELVDVIRRTEKSWMSKT